MNFKIAKNITFVKIIIFAAGVAAALFVYDDLKTPGYSKELLHEISCIENEAEKLPYTKCSEEKSDRRRPAYSKIVESYPEVAQRIVLLRDRSLDIAKHSRQHSNWALNMHLGFTTFIFVLFLFILLFMHGKAKNSEQDGEGKTIVNQIFGVFSNYSSTLILLAGLILALSQSFAYHAKYQATFVAARQFDSLAFDIDVRVIDFISKLKDGKMSAKDQTELSKMVAEWTKSFSAIRAEYAKDYSGSYAPIAFDIGS